MTRIKPEDLPDVLLYTLAEMAEEMPVSEEWKQCAARLSDEQKLLIYEKRREVRNYRANKRLASMTKEEIVSEKAKRKDW